MEVSQAIRARRSTRSFLPDPVSRRDMEGILDTARWCGSFVNCQPWKFTVLGGAVMAGSPSFAVGRAGERLPRGH